MVILKAKEDCAMDLRSIVSRTACRFVRASLFVAVLFCNPIAYGASADREKLLEGAKKEGKLVLYTGMDVEEANQYTKEFTKKYPFIKPDVFRSSGERCRPSS